MPIFPIGIWINPPTGSMRPTYDGCDITVYGPANLEEGDIAWYWKSNEPTLTQHRVLEKNTSGYLIKGDNVDELDGLINKQRIHAETYLYNDIGVPVSLCRDISKPLYNSYYDLTGDKNKTLADVRRT